MPTYVYEFIDTQETIEISHSIFDDALKEFPHPESGEIMAVKRIIAGVPAVHYKGGGWTVNSKDRGYQGKFKNKIRPAGSPVDTPAHKREADMQFQHYVDSGGLDGIKPTFNFSSGTTPQTTEQMMDKSYKPK